jgi:hypothetical protein
MLSDHTGVLRPCPSCAIPVLHAQTGQGIDERWFTLDKQSGSGGQRWVSRGTQRQKNSDDWRLEVVQSAGDGYRMHQCRKTVESEEVHSG